MWQCDQWGENCSCFGEVTRDDSIYNLRVLRIDPGTEAVDLVYDSPLPTRPGSDGYPLSMDTFGTKVSVAITLLPPEGERFFRARWFSFDGGA